MFPLICQPLPPALASLSLSKAVSSVRATCYQVSVCEKVKGTETEPARFRAWSPSESGTTGIHIQSHSDSAGGLTEHMPKVLPV